MAPMPRKNAERGSTDSHHDFGDALEPSEEAKDAHRPQQPQRVDPPRCGRAPFKQMCSGSEAGSYLRLIDFVYHSTLGLSVIKKKTEEAEDAHRPQQR